MVVCGLEGLLVWAREGVAAVSNAQHNTEILLMLKITGVHLRERDRRGYHDGFALPDASLQSTGLRKCTGQENGTILPAGPPLSYQEDYILAAF